MLPDRARIQEDGANHAARQGSSSWNHHSSHHIRGFVSVCVGDALVSCLRLTFIFLAMEAACLMLLVVFGLFLMISHCCPFFGSIQVILDP